VTAITAFFTLMKSAIIFITSKTQKAERMVYMLARTKQLFSQSKALTSGVLDFLLDDESVSVKHVIEKRLDDGARHRVTLCWAKGPQGCLEVTWVE
jgi:hypothetical protein